jgi:hypothetical protein
MFVTYSGFGIYTTRMALIFLRHSVNLARWYVQSMYSVMLFLKACANRSEKPAIVLKHGIVSKKQFFGDMEEECGRMTYADEK